MCHESDNRALHLNHCTFTSNAAMDQGGAVYSLASNIQSEQIQFLAHNRTFARNTASGPGGALCLNQTKATISHSKLVNNTSPVGGTIHFTGLHSTLYITNSDIWKSNYAGKEYPNFAAVNVSPAKHLFANNVNFQDNDGALKLVKTPKAEIYNCSFVQNTEFAISATNSKLFLVRNTSFIENQDYSVLVLLSAMEILLQNCTFTMSGLVLGRYYPTAIDIDASGNISLRSYGNMFSVLPAEYQDELIQVINLTLFGLSESAVTLYFYFWDNWYQRNHSKLYPVNIDMIHNITTFQGILNVSAELSQFASGKFQFKIQTRMRTCANSMACEAKYMASELVAEPQSICVYPVSIFSTTITLPQWMFLLLFN